jgi:hypothetical protein
MRLTMEIVIITARKSKIPAIDDKIFFTGLNKTALCRTKLSYKKQQRNDPLIHNLPLININLTSANNLSQRI